MGAAALAAALVLSLVRSHAAEAEPPQRAQIVAAVDITPIRDEISALRAEIATIRQAIADPQGVRGEIAAAAKAVKAMDDRLTDLTETFKKYAESTEPVVKALAPAKRWEYRILRSRSETVANRWGNEGWILVTALEDGLYFKRPLEEAKEREKEKGEK
jgi:HAMP domain-containing protein